MDSTKDILQRIAAGDQAQASTDEWTQMLSRYYKSLIKSGLPSNLAALLVRDYHALMLQSGLRRPKQEP